jgi:TatD DNase family protein
MRRRAGRQPVMWIDTHLHLDAQEFDVDRDEVLARAAAADVGLLITAGVSVEESRALLELARRYPTIRVAVGVHPHAADRAGPSWLSRLAALAAQPGVVAIGEIGLDYNRSENDSAAQIEVFRAQVRLAREVGLPIVVHNRGALEDVERILFEEESRRVVAHCFTETADVAVRWAAAGWMVSFAGILTFQNAGPLREAAQAVPTANLLIETDAPYLAPVPVRGRRCEPAHLLYTARRLAELRGVSLDALETLLEDNSRRVFDIHRTDG